MLTFLVFLIGANLAREAIAQKQGSVNCSTNFLSMTEDVKVQKSYSNMDDSLGTGILKAFASSCEAERDGAPLIIDVGSNKGGTLLRYFTIFSNLEDIMLRKWYHSQGMFEFDMGKVLQSAPQVFAIDPLKTAEKKMSKLIVDFQLTSYLHFDALAMGNTTGTVHMYLPKEKGRVDEGGQIETSGVESQWKDRGGVKVEGIEMTTIDRYLAGKKLLGKEIAFLKIDVEKLDFLVIQGASNVFKNQLVQLGQYEYIDGAISLVEITEWLKERGYTSYVMWSPRNVLRLDGLSREGIERVSGKLAQVNVLFARMKDRCVSRALASYAGKPNLFPFKCFRGTIEHSPLLK